MISVGTRPYRPHSVPFDKKHVFDSDEMLSIEQLPRTLTVIGGGVIGVEYATIFSALDVPVTLIESRNTILDFVDSEIVDDFLHQMRDRGMAIRLGSTVKEIAVDKGSVEITLGDGRTVRSQIVLYAAGRSGNVGSLGLDTVGIEVDSRGRIKANPETFQTTVPNIYAAGRRDRLPEPCLDGDGAGQGGRLPRLRRDAAAAAGNVPVRHLFGAGDLDGRAVGRAGAQLGNALRDRCRAVPRDVARPHHGRRFRLPEADLLDRDAAAARRAYRRRGARPS